MPLLELKTVSKRFNGTPVLEDVSLSVGRGEIMALLGPSGSGKTTILRIIAGLERADSGQVLLEGRDLGGMPVHRRDVGFMFQEFALFPHKDVYGNVAFGLRMAGLPRDEISHRVNEALELVGLSGLGRRSVFELSGGEQQRVALARSLAPRPRLLLLDEPLGSLDRVLRERLMNELRDILKAVQVTALYVTHDQIEAFAVSDRIAVMQKGCIEQVGTPQGVYQEPASPFIARFLGMTNLMPGQLIDPLTGRVKTPVGVLRADGTTGDAYRAGQELTVLLRPEAARLAREAPDDAGANLLEGRVEECSFRGAYYRLVIRHAGGTQLAFEMDRSEDMVPSLGDPVTLALPPEGINLFEEREA